VLSADGGFEGYAVSPLPAPQRAETSETAEASALGRACLPRRLVAEALGTALLLATVIGSGIMAERLSGGNVALALLANTIATGAGLLALILTFDGISGAHFNPVVTVADASQGGLPWKDVAPYVAVQLLGAFAGVALAHMMFDAPPFSVSRHARTGLGQLAGEFTATFGLLAVIRGCSRARPLMTPFAVAAYITAAYWFTSSTSFANPAVTLARAMSDTFAGIRPTDTPGFIVAQALGAASATLLFRWLLPIHPTIADRGVITDERESAA
jgi:glycerol uptake facilitator-like aquaporin